MKKLSIALASTALMALVGVNPAKAASFNFSYTLQGGSVLGGMLDGDLQGDGDTVFVNSITMPTFNGLVASEVPDIFAVTTFFGGPATEAKVSLSGLVMDIIACTAPGCPEGFLFDGAGALFGAPAHLSSSSYGNAFELYNRAQWTLTEKTTQAVPEPASVLGLVVIGSLGLATKRQRPAA